MKELKFNIQYLFSKKEFYLAIIISFLINFIQAVLCVRWSITTDTPFEKSVSGEYQFIFYNVNVVLNLLIIIAFPILFSMVFSDSNILEGERKTKNLLYTRLNLQKNTRVRMVLSFVITFVISLFSFLFNYLILRIIYGSGNLLTYSQEIAFSMTERIGFLLGIKEYNSFLFILFVSGSVSLVLGLISSFSYLFANILNKRVVSYFIPLLFIILWEAFINVIGFEKISFISFLQPANKYTVSEYVVGVSILLGINIVLCIVQVFKKDYII